MNEKYEKILNTSFYTMEGDNVTIRRYLHKLLTTLWSQGEGFSGKRPFGNSGWEFDLYKGLINYSREYGSLDEEEGYVEDVNTLKCNDMIFDLIDYIFSDSNDAQLYLNLEE